MGYSFVRSGLINVRSHVMPGYTGNEYNRVTGGYNLHGGAKVRMNMCIEDMLEQCNAAGIPSVAIKIKELHAEFLDSKTKPSRRSDIADSLLLIADSIYDK